jgi:gamma-glutamyltranspeptidase/glutathione hydrolase
MIITTVLQLLLERVDLRATLPEAIARPRASQRNTATTIAEPAFRDSPEGRELDDVYGHEFGTQAEIGAATGLEFLPGRRVLAAAEPVRRGGGSAMVERP